MTNIFGSFQSLIDTVTKRKLFDRIIEIPIQLTEIVDMGPLEQRQVLQILTNNANSWAIQEAKAALYDKHGLRLSVTPHVHASPLVNPVGSALTVSDVHDKGLEGLDPLGGDNRNRSVYAGLQRFFSTDITAHVAPRYQSDGPQEEGNRLEETWLAVLNNGSVISSVGANSLSDITDQIHTIYAVNHKFVAAGSAQGIDEASLIDDAGSRINTQYTAAYNRPALAAKLLESKIKVLTDCSRQEAETLLQTEDGIRELSRRAVARYLNYLEGKPKDLVAAVLPESAHDSIWRYAEINEIPPIPELILIKRDNYGILNFRILSETWEQLRGENYNEGVYITLRDARGELRTHFATTQKGSFDGRVGELVLSASAHKNLNGENHAGFVELNIFNRVAPGELFYQESPAGRFGNQSHAHDIIEVGRPITAIVPAKLIDAAASQLGITNREQFVNTLAAAGILNKASHLNTDQSSVDSLVDTIRDKGVLQNRHSNDNSVRPTNGSANSNPILQQFNHG